MKSDLKTAPGARVVSSVAILFALARAIVGAETRTAATTVGVKIERHAGIYLSASAPRIGTVFLRSSEERLAPAAFGNGASELTVSRGNGPFARTSNGARRNEVMLTVFEP